MSWSSAISALAQLGSSTLDAAGATGWLGYSSAKSLNKATTLQSAKTSYRYAQKYALNSPSWQVQGLRNAGLNPILAASNIGASSSPTFSGSASSTIADPSVGNPVNSALESSNLRKQNLNLDKQNDLLSAQKGQVEADIVKTLSDAQLNSAKTKNTLQDTLNKANTRGQSGVYGAVNQYGQDIEKLFNRAKDGSVSAGKKVVDFIKRTTSPSSNSAKDYHEGVKKLKNQQFGGAFYDSRH